MVEALILLGALLLPVVLGLGMLLWLAHLEETLPRDVERAIRQAAPPPILAVPVRARQQAVEQPVPAQRLVPVPAMTTEMRPALPASLQPGVELSA